MRKVHAVFLFLTILAAAAGILHGGILYALWSAPGYLSSFPAETAFLLTGAGYGSAVAILLIVWLAIWLIARGKARREGGKNIKQ